jgi:hypothetical protein
MKKQEREINERMPKPTTIREGRIIFKLFKSILFGLCLWSFLLVDYLGSIVFKSNYEKRFAFHFPKKKNETRE